jgi:uracil-DNA glycosylase
VRTTEARRRWEATSDEAAGCTRCPLHADATATVFGEGPVPATIMLVGEQPGDREDLAGRPFVGPAGPCSTGASRRPGAAARRCT